MGKNETNKTGSTPEAEAKAKAEAAKGKLTKVTVRTKHGKPYRRLGKVWAREWTSDEVDKEDLATLQDDPWLDVKS